MKKQLINGAIILLSLSLIGIIIIQLFWISNAIKVKEEQFDQQVNEALLSIGEKLQMKDAVYFLSDKLHSIQSDDTVFSISIDHGESFIDYNFQDSLLNNYVIVTTVNPDDKEKNIIIEKSVHQDDKHIQVKSFVSGDNIKEVFEDTYIMSDGPVSVSVPDKQQFHYRIKKFDKAVQKLVFEYGTKDVFNLEHIDLASITELISDEFSARGLPGSFEVAISDDQNQGYLYKSEKYDASEKFQVYQTGLFPEKVFEESSTISVFFPEKNAHILRSIYLLVMGSVLFTLLIILTFSIAIHIILKQKKISDIKSDFINNMTHEFKTPIATISLAADSISNEKIISDKKQVNYYAGIIKEENKRMNTQVESVLKMSLLDKKEMSLNIVEMDVHEIIRNAIKSINIQFENNGGSIEALLKAENSKVLADEIHFTNVLYNLLDNAQKYSKKDPDILVSTTNINDEIVITVEDHGIGMSTETQKRIFDKFYRFPTGNVHNVKGFGLGLSYVKAIVVACGGRITVKSAPGKVSRFIINLPVVK